LLFSHGDVHGLACRLRVLKAVDDDNNVQDDKDGDSNYLVYCERCFKQEVIKQESINDGDVSAHGDES